MESPLACVKETRLTGLIRVPQEHQNASSLSVFRAFQRLMMHSWLDEYIGSRQTQGNNAPQLLVYPLSLRNESKVL